MIDPAMLRPGRLDKPLYVDLPTPPERHEILKTLTKRTPLHGSVSLLEIATAAFCEGFSGADLAALVREASVGALRCRLEEVEKERDSSEDAKRLECLDVWVRQEDFLEAGKRVKPSVSAMDRRRYEMLKCKFSNQ
jgi:ribosome biogenesis ATPase